MSSLSHTLETIEDALLELTHGEAPCGDCMGSGCSECEMTGADLDSRDAIRLAVSKVLLSVEDSSKEARVVIAGILSAPRERSEPTPDEPPEQPQSDDGGASYAGLLVAELDKVRLGAQAMESLVQALVAPLTDVAKLMPLVAASRKASAQNQTAFAAVCKAIEAEGGRVVYMGENGLRWVYVTHPPDSGYSVGAEDDVTVEPSPMGAEVNRLVAAHQQAAAADIDAACSLCELLAKLTGRKWS